MSASAETTLRSRLVAVLAARRSLQSARLKERTAMVLFMTEAQHQGLSWTRIGDLLEISATGARRYYGRNRWRVTARAAGEES